MSSLRRLGRTGRAALSVGMLLFILTGCASPSEEVGDPAPTARDDTEISDLQSEFDSLWEYALQLAPGLQDTERPTPTVIRLIDLQEYPEVISRCMHEAGFTDVTTTWDGGVSTFIPSGTEESYALAWYSCGAQYPTHPKYSKPLNSDQIRRLYQHFAGPLRDCLTQAGYPTAEPPSLEKFSETYATEQSWNPLNEVLAAAQDVALTRELNELCPSSPEGLYDEEPQ